MKIIETKYMVFFKTTLLYILFGIFFPGIALAQNTCTSSTDGTWLNSGTWSCDTGIPKPPDGDWGAPAPDDGQYIVIQHNIDIANNKIVDLSASNTVEVRIKGTGSLAFGANAKLILPSGATIVLEDGATISASNNSNGTLIEIGGNGVWGNSCEGCSNEELTGPGAMDENSDPNSPLPVEFLYVKAKAIEHKVNIAWATASELNNNFFTVEQSTDGKNFTAIGEIKGAGDSQQTLTYNFTDDKPAAGINYYRVKQTDFDGAFDYSETVAAHISVQNDESLVVCPNPATGIFKINMSAYNEQQVFLEIVNFSGQPVETRAYDFSEHLDLWIQIDLSERPKGLYYVILKTTTQVRKGKVIII